MKKILLMVCLCFVFLVGSATAIAADTISNDGVSPSDAPVVTPNGDEPPDAN